MTRRQKAVLILIIFIALPFFFNYGSRNYGCMFYEMRTGQPCFDILECR